MPSFSICRRLVRWAGRNACPYYAIVLGSIAIGSAQDKGRFEPQPVTEYRARQTVDKVTIAVEPFEGGEKVKRAFGKSDPAKFGVLPVLVVIANDSDRALQLERMRVQLITADRKMADSVPAEEVPRTGRLKSPDVGGRRPIPGIGRGSRKPKEEWEIAAREFVAPMVAAGGKAHGFFYFRVTRDRTAGSQVYITGIRDARTGQDLLYFEISLDGYLKNP